MKRQQRAAHAVIAALALSGCGLALVACAPAAPPVEEVAQATDARAIAEAAFGHYRDGLSTGDWEPFLASLAPDVTLRFPMGRFRGEHRGIEAAREFFRHNAEAFPGGIQTERIERITAEGDRVFFELAAEDKQRGQLYRNWVAVAMDVCGDKICGYREYFGLVGPPPAS